MKIERGLTASVKYIALAAFLSFIPISPPVFSAQEGSYTAVPGLLDLRSTFSDGKHSIEELAKIALERGFKVLFINDHDQISLSYGLPPFRNIMSYKKEFPSIKTHGPEKYLGEIDRVSKKYPEIIIIPGSITSAYYYWTGSWLKKNLTAHEYDRRILIVNFDQAEDYYGIPNIGNRLSSRYTKRLLPGVIVFAVPLFIGFILVRWRGFYRVMGLILMVFSTLGIIDLNPLRSSLFSPYMGNQGIKPYRELIDYVNERGGFSFWNYPEQRSGVRRYGPINVSTPPYPQVLYRSLGYTGFAAIYGDNITVTEPGNLWDMVLNEYCWGKRRNAPWGISTADFHEDGRLGLKLGAFPTTFLVREFSKKGVLEAMKKGRMYSSRGDGFVWPRLDYFNVLGTGGERAFMGETLTTPEFPVIRYGVTYGSGKSVPVVIHLIRGGSLIHTFRGQTPVEVEYVDRQAPIGEKTYYRLMDSKKHLASNPVFVKYVPAPPGEKMNRSIHKG